MAGEIPLTVVGNLTADPELRFSPSGDAVANFTVASTPRVFKDGSWVNGEAVFVRVSAWRKLGENVAESFKKGERVMVTGRLKQRSYETKQNEKRSVFELEAEDVGASVMFRSLGAGEPARKASQPANSAATGSDPGWGGNTGWGGASPATEDDPPF